MFGKLQNDRSDVKRKGSWPWQAAQRPGCRPVEHEFHPLCVRANGTATPSALAFIQPRGRWISFPGSENRSRFARQVRLLIIEELIVNKDQVKGAAKDIAGKIQEEAGKLIGSREQEAKGLKHQAEGKVQKGVGDLKEAVSDLKEAVKKG
jgi:uncharacterized protein YjbJ (UPF0337 family)